ncbi:unnamed protein product [Vitrella brassicaformis CCMP3155]|uniref:Ubiquitin-like protein ATG12 n=1 Tax=Vitrella brassicaformis (strain CCMP3155) TaxID=1169540 RepID=A0A0G4EPM8_VITBC|nr:unnamed protein product [Vitrella brassicaformis CCMP3155]|eukprot:CEL99395.1 unnamed protein product [Vitrella brassicaformis CCMP3155]
MSIETVKEHFNSIRESKVVVDLRPIANAPVLKTGKFKVSGQETFADLKSRIETMVKRDTVYLYVNNSFEPSPDDYLFDLFECFKTGEQLNIGYSLTPAFH